MMIPDDNNDHITLKYMILFETIQGSRDLFYDMVFLSDCYNPSITTYRNRYLLACRSHGNLHGPMTLSWLDPNTFEIDTSNSYLGIGPGKTTVSHVDGEDYRLYDSNDGKVTVTYTFYPERSFAQMRIAKLGVSGSELVTESDYHLVPSVAQRARLKEILKEETERDFMKEHQKNWCPLKWGNQTLLIKYVHPLEIISYKPMTDGSGRAEFDDLPTPSLHVPFPKIEWGFGELRGGTPALLIQPDLLLAFFHSKWTLPGSRLISYFFGAYTLSVGPGPTSKWPSFTLKSVSRVPLVHRVMYDGAWSHYKNYVDYIVFPMSFVILPRNSSITPPSSRRILEESSIETDDVPGLSSAGTDYLKSQKKTDGKDSNDRLKESKKKHSEGDAEKLQEFDPLDCDEECLQDTSLLISIGVQDKDGWLARVNLGQLLDSLVHVKN